MNAYMYLVYWKTYCLAPFLQIIFLFCLNKDRILQIFNGL